MSALTADRNTPRRENREIEAHPVKGGVKIFAGGLVLLDPNGFAVPGKAAVGHFAVGRADQHVDATSSADGEQSVTTRRGVLRFANSAGADAITRAQVGKAAYAVDDQTFAKTDGGGTRSPAGIIRDVDAQGVWVEL